MHITLEADYAVRIVHYLAISGGRLDAKTLSQKTMVPLRFSLKILRKLVVSGIIKSYKGMQGGYEIAKDLSEISLCDIIETVVGQYAFSRCLGDDYNCNKCGGKPCGYQEIYDEITAMVRKKLQSVKIAEMIS